MSARPNDRAESAFPVPAPWYQAAGLAAFLTARTISYATVPIASARSMRGPTVMSQQAVKSETPVSEGEAARAPVAGLVAK